MKPTPLKNKLWNSVRYCEDEHPKGSRELFLKKDIKSAVEWLLERVMYGSTLADLDGALKKEGIIEINARRIQLVKSAFPDIFEVKKDVRD